MVPASLQHVHTQEVVYKAVEDAALTIEICLASRRGEPAVAVRNFIKMIRKTAQQRSRIPAG